MRNVWLEQGGVWAAGGLRGGGEWGEAWHRSGRLRTKQNVFDDFIACARLLIDAKYTKPSRLAIEGGSNGGLLMGAAFTQHPELFGAVVSHVGICDMLRVELSSNGEFNVTGLGTVRDRAQFDCPLRLLAVSPRRGRDEVPSDPHDDRRERPARGSIAVAEDDRAPPGRGGRLAARPPAPRARARATASAARSARRWARPPTWTPSSSTGRGVVYEPVP